MKQKTAGALLVNQHSGLSKPPQKVRSDRLEKISIKPGIDAIKAKATPGTQKKLEVISFHHV